MKTIEDFTDKINKVLSRYIGEPINEKTKDNIRRETTTIFLNGKQLGIIPSNTELSFSFGIDKVHINIGEINESSKDNIPDSKECE